MKTEATPFYDVPVVADDAFVFEVRAGIPADLALDLATGQLDAAIRTIHEAADSLGKRPEASLIYTALYTLEQALALCYSISRSVMRSTDDQSEGEQVEALHLDLTDQELSHLRAVAEQEGADLSHTAARLLGAALRHHADVVAGGAA
jgi:hypothetical protein